MYVLADSGQMLLFMGSAVLVGVFFLLFHLAEKKRTDQFRVVAEDLGFEFYPRGDDSLISRLDQFELFSRGRGRKIKNMLHGETNEVEVAIFDYQYTTGGGNNSSTHRHTVIWFHSESLNLPGFALRPEGFLHKVGNMFGYQDFDFATHPGFSNKYLLRGQSEKAVRNTFTEDVLDFFESKSQVCAEGEGRYLVFYRRGRRVKPHEVKELMQQGFEAYSVLKDKTDHE